MRVGAAHLTYCTNIHPGESWAEVRANLARHVVSVKAKVSPGAPFGVGLRLSARAAQELTDGALPELQHLLAAHDLYVFTINGFPYGTFHGTPVKDAVYRPDWLEAERVAYTNQLADLLAQLLPDGVDGSISTVPGCFRARDRAGAMRDIAGNLRRSAAHCAALERATGKRITLAIEPEPCCVVETIDEAIALFAEHLRDVSHLGLCLDACHAAVEYEDLPAALAKLGAAAIPIAKIQLSVGLSVAPVDARQRAELARFSDAIYLHQVVARHGTTLTRYTDLPEALGAALADVRATDEWRVHFHVPIVRSDLGSFASTQDFLAGLLALQRKAPLSTHLEVETYTWDVLPAELRDAPIDDAVAGELRWVLERLR